MKPRAAHRVRSQALLGCLPASSGLTPAVSVLAVVAFAARYVPSYGYDVPPDQPVTLSPIPARQTDELAAITFAASGNGTLAFPLTSPPDGASINSATGAFSRIPAEHQDGLHRFNLTVSDGRGGSDSRTASVGVLEVNQPPAFDAAPNRVTSDLFPLSLNLAATDPDLPAGTPACSLVDPPEGASADPRTGHFSWTQVVTGGRIDTIAVLVDEGAGGSDFLAIEIEAPEAAAPRSHDENPPPTVNPIRPFYCNADECSTVVFTVTASDPDGDTLTFRLGDDAPDDATVGSSSGIVTWETVSDDAVPSHRINAIASDGCASDSSSTYVAVWMVLPELSNRPGALTVDAGDALSRTITATGGACDDRTVGYPLYGQTRDAASRQADMRHYIDEYAPPSGASISSGTGAFSWITSDSRIGLHRVAIAAHDGDGRFNDLLFHVRANRPPNHHPTAGPDLTVMEGDTVALSGTASDGDPPTYLWAHDRTGLPIILENATALSTTFAAPSADADTAATFTLTADDGSGASSTDTVPVTILAEGSPPDAPQNLRLGATTDTTVALIRDDPGDATIAGYKALSRAPATRTRPSTLIDNTGSAETAYAVRDLEPGTTYAFRVAAINEHGYSDRSNFVRISTPS